MHKQGGPLGGLYLFLFSFCSGTQTPAHMPWSFVGLVGGRPYGTALSFRNDLLFCVSWRTAEKILSGKMAINRRVMVNRHQLVSNQQQILVSWLRSGIPESGRVFFFAFRTALVKMRVSCVHVKFHLGCKIAVN